MKRILIAEDEDVIRDFIVINLKRAGYDVVDVPDGEQALQVFEQSGGDFDVVVLDIMSRESMVLACAEKIPCGQQYDRYHYAVRQIPGNG